MRYMIVHRVMNFPEKYHQSSDYCKNMAMNGIAANMLELQVIADICFSVVECYSTENFLMPYDVILPLRSE